MCRSNVRLLPKPRPGTETKGGLGHNHDADCLQHVVRTCRRLLEPMRQKHREATAVTSEWGRGVHLWRLSSTVCGWFLIYRLCFVADSQSRWGRSAEKHLRWPVSEGGSAHLWKFHCMQMIPHIPVLSYILLHSYKDQTASNTKQGIKSKQPTSLHWKLSQNSYWHIYRTIWGFTERMTIPQHLVQRSDLTKLWPWVPNIDANSQLLSH